ALGLARALRPGPRRLLWAMDLQPGDGHVRLLLRRRAACSPTNESSWPSLDSHRTVLAHADDVVAGRLGVGGTEAGVDRIQVAGLEGDRGRDVEVVVGDGADQPTPVEGPRQHDHGDLVEPVL